MSTEVDIPEASKSTLNELAERLWSGHASVMVGSGFSKNSVKKSSSCKPFLTWNELANVFYKKLHNELPPHTENYLNPLKLADEVEAAFGRSSLEKLIQLEIPDTGYSPSHLHTKLLELPWNDVFTTNYDTLLERTQTPDRYDVVLSKNDLVYSQRPRIIKLHGSFPSHRPFIITEEDYRKYPHENAPFVNTVQQSLIENTLCLLGFSGDDPNFLRWIGWIRDNLGTASAPKVYLIGVFSLSSSQIKLLEKRNIVVLDLLDCVKDQSDQHEAALELFLNYLKSKKSDKSRLDWPKEKRPPLSSFHDTEDKFISDLKETTKIWANSRKNYPGWVICPYDRRQVLWTNTNQWVYGKHLSMSLPPSLDIDFWFELTWRLDKALIPLLEQIIIPLEKVVSRYNPHPNKVNFKSKDELNSKNRPELDWADIGFKWVSINIYLLRFYREERDEKKWVKTYEVLDNRKHHLSNEHLDSIQYERCLYLLSQQEIKQLEECLNSWKPNGPNYFYLAKKAGLLAEIGNAKEAEVILENSLQRVRAQLNLVPVTTDYSEVSQEAYILQLLKYVKDSISIFESDEKNNKEYVEEYSQRWDQLKKFKCDPWGELKLFNANLDSAPQEIKSSVVRTNFDIGSVTTTTKNFGAVDKEALNGYSFLRYIEDVGIPLHISHTTFGKNSAIGAIKRIAYYSPYWAIIALLRLGDSKSVDILFNRKALMKLEEMKSKKVDSIASMLLRVLESLASKIEKSGKLENKNIGSHYAQIIPEILSRLCTKNSLKIKRDLLLFLEKIFNSENKHKYSNIGNLGRRLVISWPISDFPFLVSRIINDFPVIESEHPLIKKEFYDLLSYVRSRDFDIDLISKTDVELKESNVDELLLGLSNKTGEVRAAYFKRLLILHDFDLLNGGQKNKFADIIWSHTDGDGFPTDLPNFYKFTFFSIPLKEGVKLESSYLNYLLRLEFPVLGNAKSFPFNGGECTSCSELIGGASYFPKIGWSSTNSAELFEKIHNWWTSDKHFLKEKDLGDPFMSRWAEMRLKFHKAVLVLSNCVVPFLKQKEFNSKKGTLKKIASEMEELGVPVAELKSALLSHSPQISRSYLDDIIKGAYGNDEFNSIKSIIALTNLLDPKKNSNIDQIDLYNVILPLVDTVKLRKYPALVASLANLSFLIEHSLFEIKPHISNILFGLESLVSESDILDENSLLPQSKRLHIREYSAALAYKLYNHHVAEGVSIPSVLNKWKDVCDDPNEFSEIRNQWEAL